MLIKDGKVHYARIGIGLEPLSPAVCRQLGLDEGTKGVVVGNVFKGTPAEKAGLKEGDVITGFAGEKVQDRSSFRLKVATSEVSKPYDLTYIRDGKTRTTTIVPAPAENVVFDTEGQGRSTERRSTGESAKTAISAFGLEVQPLSPELGKQLGVPSDVKGVVVTDVKDGSPAEAAGIQEGDVITKVIRDRKFQPLASVQEFQELASKTDELALYVQTGRLGRLVVLSKTAK
jgi:serine protease Do